MILAWHLTTEFGLCALKKRLSVKLAPEGISVNMITPGSAIVAFCMPMSAAIGVGILGSSWMVAPHGLAYGRFREMWPEHELAPVVVHVADFDAASAEALAARCGAAKWSTDWRAVLDDPAVEIVHVTPPHHLHAPMMSAAADARRHVACETPMGLKVSEARAIVAAVARVGVVSQVGYHHRLLPPIAHAQRLVEGFGDASTVRRSEPWRLQRGGKVMPCQIYCDCTLAWAFECKEVPGWIAPQ